MNEEIAESAKAIQEVAKATRTGIEATEKLGGFVARVINEPIEHVTGILSDRLRFMRWERQLRLGDRVLEKIKERGLEAKFNNGQLNIVPPKLALPIIENASLEEDDELQDLWANLLTSALDPNFNSKIRSAYIDIIKQLEVVDVRILDVIYKSYNQWLEERSGRVRNPNRIRYTHIGHSVYKINIIKPLELALTTYENSIDNLIRVRCISSFIENKHIETEVWDVPSSQDVTLDHGYERVCMTTFGVNFVEACINSKLTDSPDRSA
jgi:hypothetical protein